MKTALKSGFSLAILFAILSIAGCEKKTDPPESLIEIELTSNATLGNILVDKNGHSLYFSSNDSKGQNSCTGGCETTFRNSIHLVINTRHLLTFG